MAKVIMAESVHNPMKLNSAGEPEVIIEAGSEMKSWHFDAIEKAGIEEVKLVMVVPFAHICKVEDDGITY